MSDDKFILEVLLQITAVANNRKLRFEEKLNKILLAIVSCMQVKKASIMLFKNNKVLEVVASTNPSIIGKTQSIDENTPSTWVVKHKQPLYVDSESNCDVSIRRFAHYAGDAFFLVPIIYNEQVIGVINVTEKIGSDIFRNEERDILLHIVGHVIIALENHRLAESLKKSHAIVTKKNKDLKKLEKLRTELFNMLIHDLKGPISEIVANLDILSYTLSDENLSFVETAKNGCDTLYSMISNLLDISRLEEGKLPLIVEDINPKELIRESLARLLVSVRSKELKIIEDVPQCEDVTFPADRSLLIRVLQNLLTNAIQHSPHGKNVTIGYQYKQNGEIEFYVKDDGPGIPVSLQESIFDKYTQIAKKSDGRMYTAGLGLAYCRMAVQAHGGTIGVQSDGQKGSIFLFKISGKRIKIPRVHLTSENVNI